MPSRRVERHSPQAAELPDPDGTPPRRATLSQRVDPSDPLLPVAEAVEQAVFDAQLELRIDRVGTGWLALFLVDGEQAWFLATDDMDGARLYPSEREARDALALLVSIVDFRRAQRGGAGDHRSAA